MTAANIRRHHTRFLFLQNPDDLLIAESAAFDLSVPLRNRFYRKMATFQGGTSSGYIKRSQLCAYQKGPELVCLGPELLSSIKVDAGTRNQLDLLLNA
jgi:hypothetical protein